MLKEIDTEKWKNISCSFIGRSYIGKMTILPKAMYRFSAIPIKIQIAFFKEIEQTLMKFIWNHKSCQDSQSNPNKKEEEWWYHSSRLWTILQSYNKIVLSGTKTDQWNRIKSKKLNHTYMDIYNKGAQNMY